MLHLFKSILCAQEKAFRSLIFIGENTEKNLTFRWIIIINNNKN